MSKHIERCLAQRVEKDCQCLFGGQRAVDPLVAFDKIVPSILATAALLFPDKAIFNQFAESHLLHWFYDAPPFKGKAILSYPILSYFRWFVCL
jgi:hypothetical protein